MNFRRKISAMCVMLLAVIGLSASATGDTPQKKYIDKYKDLAVSEMHRQGIPASITLAQGLLESRAGLSYLATEGNNHFGIKCHGWRGRTVRTDDDRKNECFRAYDNADESFRDHSDFLRYQDRYKSLFDLEPTDYKGWAHGLKKAGYATDPSYAPKLISLIEEYQLYLYDSDSDLPEPPHRIEEPRAYSPSGRESFSFPLTRQMYSQNGVPFVYSVEGETYDDIARQYDLFKKEILRFNDLSSAEPLLPGTIVYLQSKKKDAAKGVDKYIVGEDGESLRDIAQRFGIRLKDLLKKNKIPADYLTREGDELILRGKGRKERIL